MGLASYQKREREICFCQLENVKFVAFAAFAGFVAFDKSKNRNSNGHTYVCVCACVCVQLTVFVEQLLGDFCGFCAMVSEIDGSIDLRFLP